MHSYVTSKNVKWCHLIWPTLYSGGNGGETAPADHCGGLLSAVEQSRLNCSGQNRLTCSFGVVNTDRRQHEWSADNRDVRWWEEREWIKVSLRMQHVQSTPGQHKILDKRVRVSSQVYNFCKVSFKKYCPEIICCILSTISFQIFNVQFHQFICSLYLRVCI